MKLNVLAVLPVVNFAAGGVATPADAALMMQLGADGVFVGQEFSNQKILLNLQEQLLKQQHIIKTIN